MIVLVGFMGAGKSSVGARLADRLGKAFIDTDSELERSAGASIAEIFDRVGERGFRELERSVIEAALQRTDGIASLGGGALGDPATRAALEWADVVFLDVSFAEAMRRIGDDDDRPMLRNTDPKALYDERREMYVSAADVTVTTDGRDIEEIVEELAGRFGGTARDTRVRVETEHPYDVLIGDGLLERFTELVPVPDMAHRAALITHPVLRSYAEKVADSLTSIDTTILEAPEGESSKQLLHAAALYDGLAGAGLRRGDVVVGVGGGVICDLAGFVASTYHRGLAVVHVPTSLLAQVDAAIGGKTAVNLDAGKNLVGTFHQPIAVICDVGTLRTLPEDEFRSGMAEVVKAGLVGDPGLVELLEERADAIMQRDPDTLRAVIVRCVALKASVVAADEREHGLRAILNYGHTFGHALEHTTRGLRHGEAISLGMMAAAYTAHELDLVDKATVETHKRVLSRFGLPVTAEMTLEELEPLMIQDKKSGDVPRFVLLKGVGVPVHGVEVSREVLESALKRMDV